MKYPAIVAALLLAGCASSEPGIEIRTIEVPSPIRVEKCIATADIPKKPADLGRRTTDDARVLADLLLAKVRALQNYADKADALLQGCAAG